MKKIILPWCCSFDSQVETVVAEAKRLADLFPDAKEHISVKHTETVEVWNALLDKSAQRKDKLFQREKLQSYFGEHADLLWDILLLTGIA